MNVRGGRLKVEVECVSMETPRSLFLASTEDCLGDRSNTIPPLNRQAPHLVGSFRTIVAKFGIINDPIIGSLRPEGGVANVLPK